MPRVLAEAVDDPELHAQLVERGVRPLRQMLITMVRRGIERGELRQDTDVETVVDVLHALPVYKLLMAAGDMKSLDGMAERIVPLLLEGAQ